MRSVSASLVKTAGKTPIVGNLLRWYARRYEEGSVIRIARGNAAGLRWKRFHRYVSGYWIGIYEMEIQQALARELKSGDTFYDIGANAGFFSLLAGRLVGPAGRVLAFEPLPENIESIREQFSLNSMRQCQLIPKAVADYSGSASLVLADNNSMGRIGDAGNMESGNVMTVETTTLDDFVASEAIPDLIKVDVEGFEVEVLTGARGLLNSAHAPKLLIELHGDDKARQVEAILSARGYHLTDLSGSRLSNGAVGHTHIVAYPPNMHPRPIQ
jgi:FkbM family methyltransferase